MPKNEKHDSKSRRKDSRDKRSHTEKIFDVVLLTPVRNFISNSIQKQFNLYGPIVISLWILLLVLIGFAVSPLIPLERGAHYETFVVSLTIILGMIGGLFNSFVEIYTRGTRKETKDWNLEYREKLIVLFFTFFAIILGSVVCVLAVYYIIYFKIFGFTDIRFVQGDALLEVP